MKVLIIAGPYEADRIRRAAVSVGIEALAIEPGESLSGWITATRPEVIILAPQIVSADVAKALGKIRAVPRGRVPILLVGDGEDREKLEGAADGFFARPVVTEALFARARELAAQVVARSTDDSGSIPRSGSGPHAAGTGGEGSGPHEDSARVRVGIPAEGTPVRTPTLRPLVATGESRSSAPRGLPPDLPPHVSTAWASSEGERRRQPLFAALAQEIEATFDAELAEVVRAVGELRQASVHGVSPADAEPPEAVPLEAEPPEAAPLAAALGDEDPRIAALDETGVVSHAALGETEAAVHRARIVALHERVQDGDYFQILGVSQTADASEIRRAFEERLRAFAPGVLPEPLVTELATELSEIRLVLTEASRLLGNDTLRASYARHLPRPAPNGDSVATASSPTNDADPDADAESDALALGDQGTAP